MGPAAGPAGATSRATGSEPDNGLWEVRGARRHFVHSKVMAWAGCRPGGHAPSSEFGLRRARRPVARGCATASTPRSATTASTPTASTFTQSYGSTGLDAALLLIPRVGFLPCDDPRVVGTVDAVQRELTDDGFLLRYRTDPDDVDGLPGDEGAFLACTFWLADALHGIGRRDEAGALFERLLALRNDVGLLAEEYDPATGRQLGNTPQAFSHVGLVNAARHLAGESTGTSD